MLGGSRSNCPFSSLPRVELWGALLCFHISVLSIPKRGSLGHEFYSQNFLIAREDNHLHLVFRVCRQLLGQYHDARDSVQARSNGEPK